jgi:RNA-directed DNA polymerase
MKNRKQTVQTSLQGIAQKAAGQQKYRFRNLAVMLDEEMLLDSWRYIRKDAAYGVDRVSAREYEQDLEGNIRRMPSVFARRWGNGWRNSGWSCPKRRHE